MVPLQTDPAQPAAASLPDVRRQQLRQSRSCRWRRRSCAGRADAPNSRSCRCGTSRIRPTIAVPIAVTIAIAVTVAVVTVSIAAVAVPIAAITTAAALRLRAPRCGCGCGFQIPSVSRPVVATTAAAASLPAIPPAVTLGAAAATAAHVLTGLSAQVWHAIKRYNTLTRELNGTRGSHKKINRHSHRVSTQSPHLSAHAFVSPYSLARTSHRTSRPQARIDSMPRLPRGRPCHKIRHVDAHVIQPADKPRPHLAPRESGSSQACPRQSRTAPSACGRPCPPTTALRAPARRRLDPLHLRLRASLARGRSPRHCPTAAAARAPRPFALRSAAAARARGGGRGGIVARVRLWRRRGRHRRGARSGGVTRSQPICSASSNWPVTLT